MKLTSFFHALYIPSRKHLPIDYVRDNGHWPVCVYALSRDAVSQRHDDSYSAYTQVSPDIVFGRQHDEPKFTGPRAERSAVESTVMRLAARGVYVGRTELAVIAMCLSTEGENRDS